MTHTAQGGRILVTGGTGKTGRRVVQRLQERHTPLRVGTRTGDPPFDWQQPDTWPGVLDGVSAVYLVYLPDVAAPGAPETVGAFGELAVRSGVQRLVLQSGRGAERALATEQAVRDAGAAWTILRSSWLCQNFSEGFLLEPVLAGEVALPTGDVREPFVDADDLADIAVAALTEESHEGELYELTGPRAMTFAEAVGEIARATGRDIRFTPISTEQFAAGLAATEVPAELVEFLTELFTNLLDGRNEPLADGIERALGRPPRDFSAYARTAAASGRWQS